MKIGPKEAQVAALRHQRALDGIAKANKIAQLNRDIAALVKKPKKPKKKKKGIKR